MLTQTTTLEAFPELQNHNGAPAHGLDIPLTILRAADKTSDVQPLALEAEEAASPDTPEPVYPAGAPFYFIVLSLSLVLIMSGLDFNIVATAIPAITDHFHTSADVGWYSAAFRLTTCAFQFMFGKLYKLFSVKYVFLASIVIFLLGNLIAAVASTSITLIVGRAVAGLGTSGCIAGCFTLLVSICPMRKRPMYTSCFAIVELGASLFAPTLSGVLTQTLSWRWCFWISLPIGAVALVTMAAFLPNSGKGAAAGMSLKQTLEELNLLGNLFLVPALTLLFVALSWAGVKYPWSDPKVIGCLVAFAVLFAAFLYDQYRKQDRATIPPRIIKQRSVIAAAVYILGCSSMANVIEYYMPTYFQIVRGWSPTHSGYMMLPVIIGAGIGFTVSGSGTSIFGYYTPFMIVGSILMPVGAGLMTTWEPDTSLAKIIAYSGFLGFAEGLGWSGPQTAVQNTLSDADVPLGIAVVMFCQAFGPALFTAVAQTIFTNRLEADLKHLIPGLDANGVENLGLSELKASVGSQNLEKALQGFDKGLMQTWYLGVGLACATMVGSLMMEWRSVKQKRT